MGCHMTSSTCVRIPVCVSVVGGYGRGWVLTHLSPLDDGLLVRLVCLVLFGLELRVCLPAFFCNVPESAAGNAFGVVHFELATILGSEGCGTRGGIRREFGRLVKGVLILECVEEGCFSGYSANNEGGLEVPVGGFIEADNGSIDNQFFDEVFCCERSSQEVGYVVPC